VVRYGDESYRHRLLVGQRRYSRPVKLQREGSREHAIELKMRRLKPFGVVPGIGAVFPPWLVGYLLVTIPGVPLLKRLFGIH
jgi:hypothetical protein